MNISRIISLISKLSTRQRNNGATTGNLYNRSIVETNSYSKIVTQFKIPEPTRSLLWITDEDVSKVSSPITIKMSIDTANASSTVDNGHNLYGEPSLIWSKLPLSTSNELEKGPMYFPSYLTLSPKHRFQYLSWLTDITKPTNLSYVFLYYYGLERHLLVGDYDAAVKEILRLIEYHNKGSFVAYATSALITSSAYRKRPDIVERAPIVLGVTTNESLLLRRLAGVALTAKEIMNLSSSIGYHNKRYIKKYPKIFEEVLQTLLDNYETNNENLLKMIDISKLERIPATSFANISLPHNVRTIQIPELNKCNEFREPLFKMLRQAHEHVKMKRKNSKLFIQASVPSTPHTH